MLNMYNGKHYVNNRIEKALTVGVCWGVQRWGQAACPVYQSSVGQTSFLRLVPQQTDQGHLFQWKMGHLVHSLYF